MRSPRSGNNLLLCISNNNNNSIPVSLKRSCWRLSTALYYQQMPEGSASSCCLYQELAVFFLLSEWKFKKCFTLTTRLKDKKSHHTIIIKRTSLWAGVYTHQATLIFVVSILLMWLLLSVAVVKVIAGVERLLWLVDETAAATDCAQSQLGHWWEQGGSQTCSLEEVFKSLI